MLRRAAHRFCQYALEELPFVPENQLSMTANCSCKHQAHSLRLEPLQIRTEQYQPDAATAIDAYP